MTLDSREVAEALPGYEIGGELGRGGWGLVLAGTHKQLGRKVAIKQLPRAFAADEAVRGRFVIEAKVLASLDHPHIVPVYDFVERDGLCLLVMEELPAGTLWGRFSSEGFTQPAAAAVVLATLAGLQAAHDRGILHRDVKPENLMFAATGALKVTDFGIAKVVGGEGTLATRSGDVVGTPAYMAPEQARGGDLSAATDVYAVATMFYELLSGRLPFVDDADAMALLFKHAFETPTALHDVAPFVAPEIAAVVMRGLATDPAERFASAEAFGVAIAEACTTAWGPGWLAAEGTPVMGANTIVSATERVTTPPRPATVADLPAVQAPPRTPAPPTVADAPAAEAAPAPPAPAPAPPAPAPPPPAPVRPTSAPHAFGAVLDQVQSADLVPVQSMLVPPKKATVPLLLTLVAVAALALVALLGLGKPSTGGLQPGRFVVNGVDLSSGKVVEIDLNRPVNVTTSAQTDSNVGLAIGVAGIPLSTKYEQRHFTAVGGPNAGSTTRNIDVSSTKRIAGGRVTAEVIVRNGPSARFEAKTKQSGFLTAVGAGSVLLMLFALAYAESFARSLRRGRKLVSARVGLAIMGVLVGADLVVLLGAAAVRTATMPTLIACAALGLAAGVVGGVAAARVGKRRRFARVAERRASA